MDLPLLARGTTWGCSLYVNLCMKLTKKVKPSMFDSAFTLHFIIYLDHYFLSGSDEEIIKQR